MSTGWEIVIVKQEQIPIWDSLYDFLKENHEVFTDRKQNKKSCLKELNENKHIFSKTYSTTISYSMFSDWHLLLFDTQDREKLFYGDMAGNYETSGLQEFVQYSKLDGMWFGFADKYFWFYEIFKQGKTLIKWNSDKDTPSAKYKYPEFIIEIIAGTAEDVFLEAQNEEFPEHAAEILYGDIQLPLLQYLDPSTFVSEMFSSTHPKFTSSQLNDFIIQHLGESLNIVLYKPQNN